MRSSLIAGGLSVLALVGLIGLSAGRLMAADPWVVYEGKDGAGKGKHIVFVTGDEEYRSEESMPQLAKILAVHHGFDCTVLFAINRQTGRMEGAPEIVSRGFALAGDGSAFIENARQIVTKTLESSNQEEKTDWGVMKEKVRADLKRYIVKETARRPLIMPVILEV